MFHKLPVTSVSNLHSSHVYLTKFANNCTNPDLTDGK